MRTTKKQSNRESRAYDSVAHSPPFANGPELPNSRDDLVIAQALDLESSRAAGRRSYLPSVEDAMIVAKGLVSLLRQ